MLTPPAALHALLLASGEPLSKKRLESLLGIKSAELKLALAALDTSLQNSGTTLVQSEDEVELRTAPEAAPIVKKLRESELSRDLGKASLETLAVIAYQTGGTDKGGTGTTRGEIDWVRGVNSSASLRTLLMRGLIEGREDERDKRRVRYSITTEALAHLGARNIEELPRFAELRAAAHAVVEEGKETAA
ncbi:TPA: SMC-Scp complex subunit ScpB [Candidatus Kaiserbacteria bacterium]|nr:MAG: Segregation and condensation protein B [Parcubacteria group bacterium GW2011_GWA1_56_13]KKW46488.1 MAG: Segregation and condensation protein B [Parcubacteria group bacterium GW2011_GWB1_57_6]HCR52483.1 SMC-Scp complex subunit ScpB [Candidatus Kaiserbacteria bacterium]